MGDGIKHGDEGEVRGDWQGRVGAKRKMKWKNISWRSPSEVKPAWNIDLLSFSLSFWLKGRFYFLDGWMRASKAAGFTEFQLEVIFFFCVWDAKPKQTISRALEDTVINMWMYVWTSVFKWKWSPMIYTCTANSPLQHYTCKHGTFCTYVFDCAGPLVCFSHARPPYISQYEHN